MKGHRGRKGSQEDSEWNEREIKTLMQRIEKKKKKRRGAEKRGRDIQEKTIKRGIRTDRAELRRRKTRERYHKPISRLSEANRRKERRTWIYTKRRRISLLLLSLTRGERERPGSWHYRDGINSNRASVRSNRNQLQRAKSTIERGGHEEYGGNVRRSTHTGGHCPKYSDRESPEFGFSSKMTVSP